MIYTSGSTGKPKGIGIEHKNTCVFINWSLSVFDHASLRKVLGSTSVCFDLSIFEIFVPLCQGGACWLAKNILDLSANPSAFPVTMINTVTSAIAEIHRNNAMPKVGQGYQFGRRGITQCACTRSLSTLACRADL